MRIARIDSADDPSKGYHLERAEFSDGDFPREHDAVIYALGCFPAPAPHGYQVVAAVAVRKVTKNEPRYHIGSSRYVSVTAGMNVIGLNYIGIWLVDTDNTPVDNISTIPLDGEEGVAFTGLCLAANSEPATAESQGAAVKAQEYIRQRLRGTTIAQLRKTRELLTQRLTELETVVEKQQRLEDMLVALL